MADFEFVMGVGAATVFGLGDDLELDRILGAPRLWSRASWGREMYAIELVLTGVLSRVRSDGRPHGSASCKLYVTLSPFALVCTR